MARKKQPEVGYAVYMRTPDGVFIPRTDRRATLPLDMAESLTQDLTRMKVAWQIRDKTGMVVQSSEKEKACVEL